MSSSRPPVVSALLLGLVLGAAAGSWTQRAMFRRMMSDGPQHRRRMLERMSRELSLDEKQKAQVSALMDSRKAEIDALRKDTFARLEAIRNSVDAEIKKVLTPEQSARFDAMHRAHRMRVNWEAPAP